MRMTRKNRVLIVDEDSQSRAERKKSLEGTYRIAEAADGAEAFALMEARADWEAVDAVVYQLHDAILGHQVGQSRQAAIIVGHLVVDLAEISLDCSAQNAQISNNPGVFIQL